jgi:hypothetical protein
MTVWRPNASLPFAQRRDIRKPHQYANPAQSAALLRFRRQRPSRRAAEKCDELASSHYTSAGSGQPFCSLARISHAI